MHLRSIAASILLITSLVTISACKEKRIIGEGPATQTVRELSTFDKLEVGGNYNVNIELSNKQSVRIVAQANILPYILTTVSSKTLSIKNEKGMELSYDEAPSVFITIQKLSHITLGGASKLVMLKINNPSLSISAQGHHQVVLSGKSDQLVIESDGANEIHAENLQASNTAIAIHGSGTVFTTTTDHLDAKINGYGKIGYTGIPKSITQEIHGSGVIQNVK